MMGLVRVRILVLAETAGPAVAFKEQPQELQCVTNVISRVNDLRQ
jgi:hypothetical protein